MVPSTSTSVTIRPSMGRDSPLHLGQTYFSSRTSRLVMPLHFLWTHSIHCEHRMELQPASLQRTVQGYLPDSSKTSWPTLDARNVSFTWVPHWCIDVLLELLYADDLVLIADTQEECISMPKAWKAGMESKGQHEEDQVPGIQCWPWCFRGIWQVPLYCPL